MKLKILLFTIIAFLSFTFDVWAQDGVDELEFDLGNTGLGEIRISYFPQIRLIDTQYSTFLSWLSFIANIAILLLIIFWIYRILLAGIGAMRGGGEPDKLQESWKQIRSVFLGITFTFIIPILLIVIGFILGLGPIWDWPLAFRECKNSDEYDYYFQALQALDESNDNPRGYVDELCFGSKNN